MLDGTDTETNNRISTGSSGCATVTAPPGARPCRVRAPQSARIHVRRTSIAARGMTRVAPFGCVEGISLDPRRAALWGIRDHAIEQAEHDAQSGLPPKPSRSKNRIQSSTRSVVTGYTVTAAISESRSELPRSRSVASA